MRIERGGRWVDSSQPTKDKKLRILKATTNVLIKDGIQALSFESVAKEAGLSRQLLRYYYPNLDGLFVDLCDHLGQGYQEALIKGVVNLGQVERLNFFLDYFFGVAQDHPLPDGLEAYDAMFAYSIGCYPLRERMCATYVMLGHVISHELAIAYPTLPAFSCKELSYLFVSAMHAHWSFVATLGYDREHSVLARQAFDRLIGSYVETPDGEPVIQQPWLRQGR